MGPIRRLLEAVEYPKAVPQGVVPVLNGVGDDRADGAAELEAVAAPSASDEHSRQARCPVHYEVVVGSCGIQT